MQALFEALHVDPLDIIALVFAWKLKAQVPFEFSRSEFVNGCVLLECDSIAKLRTALRTYCSQSRVCLSFSLQLTCSVIYSV